MRIGIFGGTFNPPHRGHVTMARAAVEQLSLDKLLVIPAGIPPHKQLPEHTPDNRDRVEMTLKMADAMNTTEFLPWACTAEVDDTIDMPASWKRIVSEQLRKGACYKKFGAWPS